jgi:aspartate oxidase
MLISDTIESTAVEVSLVCRLLTPSSSEAAAFSVSLARRVLWRRSLSSCPPIPADRDVRPTVLDKQGFFGGNSTKATSGINGAATRAQASHDVKDSVKAFFDDTKKSAKDLARDDLIQVLAGNSASAVHWLEDEFGLNLSILGRLGGHSFERTHRGEGGQFPGMQITYA